jgi:hypothetical protein
MTCAPHCNVKIHSSCCCIYLCLLHCDVHLYDNLIFASHGDIEAMFLKCDVRKCLSLCDVRKCLSQCNVRKCLSLCDVRKCLSQCDVRKCLSLCDVRKCLSQCNVRKCLSQCDAGASTPRHASLHVEKRKRDRRVTPASRF